MKIIVTAGNSTTVSRCYITAESAVTRFAHPLFLPHFAPRYTAALGIAWHIDHVGKHIAPRFAHRYCHEAAPVVMVTARPGDDAAMLDARYTAFDGSLLLGNMTTVNPAVPHSLALVVNGTPVTQTTTASALPYPELMEQLSRHFTLKTGDLVIATLWPGEHELHIGDRLEASLDGATTLNNHIK